ncbi:Uncharacterised protein [BD1-7 clade bacterium]|uniref:Uncharacterized protein n=1 Tax=BD1-7 clade bacterium TaxID=2029982 RepID=A0A5S9R1X9_9GAMM|nr:Uncharacterised protein [BD1-7 clade bacterium]
MAGCCDPSERSVVWLETVAADVCCDEVQALGWIGVDPTADVTDTPLLYSPAFAWIDPLYIPDLTANPVQHVIVLDASYTDNHVLQADEPPVYQSTLRYRL